MTEAEAVLVLAGACPSFAASVPVDDGSAWNANRELSHYACDRLAAGDADDLRALLGVAEQLLDSGDQTAARVVIFGTLEDLQFITSHDDVPVSGSRQSAS
jgi:hypothetical protein